MAEDYEPFFFWCRRRIDIGQTDGKVQEAGRLTEG